MKTTLPEFIPPRDSKARHQSGKRHEPKAIRFFHKAITALELGDFVDIESSSAVPLVFEDGWGTAVAEFLEKASIGKIRIRHESEIDLRTLDAIVVMGGWAEDPTTLQQLARIPYHLHVLPTPRTALLNAIDYFDKTGRTLLCDVGKAFTKIRYSSTTRIFARNFSHFPIPSVKTSREREGSKRRLKEFLSSKIKSVVAEIGAKPEIVVISLPCTIDNNGVPTDEPYDGVKGWNTIAKDIVKSSRLSPDEIWTINEAELAGLAGAQHLDNQTPSTRAALALSLGYGVAICHIRQHEIRWSRHLPGKS